MVMMMLRKVMIRMIIFKKNGGKHSDKDNNAK